MTKWIRWSGLLGFVVVVSLIAALVVVALPWVIKTSIEYVGSRMAGAKVSVDDVSVSLSPLGVTLTRLQVADARTPMENLVEFDEAVADLELAPLLVGKAISDELSVTNLRFHTVRTESGALESPDEDDVAEDDAEPSVKEQVMAQLPSADDILAKETLKTSQAGKDLKEAWALRSEEVDTAVAEVPDSNDLSAYEAEITAITSGRLESLEDFRERKARLDALKKKFAADKQAIVSARDTIQASRRDLQQRLDTLKNAPSEDLSYLRDKYQLNGTGATNLTALLLGDDAASWASEALYWYEKIRPYLESDGEEDAEEIEVPRLAGRFVHFPTANPWPDFLIRTARLTGPFDGGQLVLEGHDLTHQQMITGRPSVLTARGDKLATIGDLDARLTLDHSRVKGRDELTLSISDWRMAPLDLGIAGAQLASSRVQIQSTAVVIDGDLDAKAKAQVRDTNFVGNGQTLFARELNQALAGINQFTVNAAAKGDLIKPSLELGSDLDRQISTALTQRLNAKQDELEAKLTQRLNAQVAEYAGDYAAELQQLIDMEGSLSERLDAVKNLASTELEDFTAQQKREAQEKADAEKAAAEAKLQAEKDRQKAEVERQKAEVERQKAEAEAKAKAEADRKKEEAKKKAADKLKSLF